MQKKINQKQFRLVKVIKKKGDRLYVKLEGYDNLFNSWIDKKRQLHLFKFELNLFNYATKTGLKNATGIDT